MKYLVPLMMILALAATSCRDRGTSGEEDASFGENVVEKPAEEILAEMRPILAPLRQVVVGGKEGTIGLDDTTRQQVVTSLTNSVTQYSAMQTAKQAFGELSREISGIAVEGAEQERWRLVEACVDVHEILNMDSVLLGRLDERAKTMLARPKIAVKGFLDDNEKGDLYVFLELMDRTTRRVKTVTVREGEVIDDLRIVEIVGRNNAVRIEYTRIPGLIFQVKGI